MDRNTASRKRKEMLGSVNLEGDPGFDCEHLANDEEKQWRWLSFPESRMVINPWECRGCNEFLPLNIGLFVNGIQKCENLAGLEVGKTADTVQGFMHCKTTWYPHKLTAQAEYLNGAKVDMTEFFTDKNTFIRMYEIHDGKDGKAVLSGEGENLNLAAGTGIMRQQDYGCAMFYQILILNSDGSVRFAVSPQIFSDSWKAVINIDSNKFSVAFAVSLSVNMQSTSENDSLLKSVNVFELLTNTKKFWNDKLSCIPAPTKWGIQSIDAKGVTPFMHKRAFYAAWTFLYQNILEPMPEYGYHYSQVTLGKASLWPNGSPKAPNSCAWESMFCIEELALQEPELAWNAAAGFINDINDDGYLDGECLPSQKAHMVWCCYINLPDKKKLADFYIKIKKYLIWRAENPRWIFFDHNYSDEKDISFVAQWYNDVDYAIKICQEIGETEDIILWNHLKTQMNQNIEKWFFTPDTGAPVNKIYNSYFSESKSHYAYDRKEDVENYICSLLCADIPKTLEDKIKKHYLELHDSNADLVGFNFYKYGDGCHTVYGLIKKSYHDSVFSRLWREFANAAIRNIIKTVEFSEECHPDRYEPFGVTPSSFGANTIIDFTYLNNGVRIDSGIPELL